LSYHALHSLDGRKRSGDLDTLYFKLYIEKKQRKKMTDIINDMLKKRDKKAESN